MLCAEVSELRVTSTEKQSALDEPAARDESASRKERDRAIKHARGEKRLRGEGLISEFRRSKIESSAEMNCHDWHEWYADRFASCRLQWDYRLCNLSTVFGREELAAQANF